MGRDDRTVKPPSLALLATEGRYWILRGFLPRHRFWPRPRVESRTRWSSCPDWGPTIGRRSLFGVFSVRLVIKSMAGAVVAIRAHPTPTSRQWPRR